MLGADHSGNVCWATHSRAMLRAVLDAVLPSYQVRERHQTTVYASPEAALAAALTVPAACDPIVAALFWFRRIPGGEPAASRLLSTAWHQTSDLDADGLRRTRRLPRGDDRVRYLGRTAGPGWWNPPRDGKRASMPPTPPPDGGFASTGSSSVPSPP